MRLSGKFLKILAVVVTLSHLVSALTEFLFSNFEKREIVIFWVVSQRKTATSAKSAGVLFWELNTKTKLLGTVVVEIIRQNLRNSSDVKLSMIFRETCKKIDNVDSVNFYLLTSVDFGSVIFGCRSCRNLIRLLGC